MVDGKVAQTVTRTSSMAVCFICKAKPSEMNNLEAIRQRPESEDAFKFGLSPLHARIKFMECILHIAYNATYSLEGGELTIRLKRNTKKPKEEFNMNLIKNLE